MSAPPRILRYDVAAESAAGDVPPGLVPALEPWFPARGELDDRLAARFGRWVTANLTGIDAAAFQAHVEGEIGRVDAAVEGYDPADLERQRDLSIKFHWGHDHDFGAFRLAGRMGGRHVTVLRNFLLAFPLDEDWFAGRRVLDIGCWTGGTALMLAALGARVTAVEEVRKYARMAAFLARSFGATIEVLEKSLYALDFDEGFDLVHVPGVIYHVSDPLLALRLLNNALSPGGSILIESEGINVAGALCRYEGSVLFHSGDRQSLSRGGWNWFSPSPLALARMMWGAGFDDVSLAWIDDRLYAHGVKRERVEITRAGLSRPDVR
ncbi:MAG: methyltransferase domain-containing protein [Alphaproteobacteria bacterium]|nr:methyltransferase domain-containing protein [Alphaproteobacteria bacterium]